jgi:hypothetical protein
MVDMKKFFTSICLLSLVATFSFGIFYNNNKTYINKKTQIEKDSYQNISNLSDIDLYKDESFARPENAEFNEERYLKIINENRLSYNPNRVPTNFREGIIYSIFHPYGFAPKNHFPLAAFLFEENSKLLSILESTIDSMYLAFNNISFIGNENLFLNGYLTGPSLGIFEQLNLRELLTEPRENIEGDIISSPIMKNDPIGSIISLFKRIFENSGKNMPVEISNILIKSLENIRALIDKTNGYIDLEWNLVFEKQNIPGTSYHKLIPIIKLTPKLNIKTKFEDFSFPLLQKRTNHLRSDIYTKQHFDYKPSSKSKFSNWITYMLERFRPSLVIENLKYYNPELGEILGLKAFITSSRRDIVFEPVPELINISGVYFQSDKELTYCYSPLRQIPNFNTQDLGDVNYIFTIIAKSIEKLNEFNRNTFAKSTNKNMQNYGAYFNLIKDDSRDCIDYPHKVLGWVTTILDQTIIAQNDIRSVVAIGGNKTIEKGFIDSNNEIRTITRTTVSFNANHPFSSGIKSRSITIEQYLENTVFHELMHSLGLKDNYIVYEKFIEDGKRNEMLTWLDSLNSTRSILGLNLTSESNGDLSIMQYMSNWTLKIGAMDILAIAYSNEIAEKYNFRNVVS